MFLGCGVQNPSLIVLTPVVVALFCILLVLRDRERVRRTALVGAKPIETPRWRMWSLPVGMFLALVGVSRPYCGIDKIEVPTLSSDRMFVVDVSRSMLTRDVQPSRIELAKRKLKDYLSSSTLAGVQERVGIVLFAGSAYIYCPMTDDHIVLNQFIDAISTELITSLGSDLDSGLNAAISAFDRSRSKDPYVLLISDGEDAKQSKQDATIQALLSRHTTVDVLAIGTQQGKPVELPDGRFLRDVRNEIVVSKLNDSFLRRLASETHGVFAIAGIGSSDIDQIVERTRKDNITAAKRGTESSSVITTYGEFGFLLLIPACILFAVAIAPRGHGMLLRLLIFSLIAPFVTAIARADDTIGPPPSGLTTIPSNARDGFLAYQRGDFRGAREALGRAHDEDPKNREIAQAYASSLYQLGEFAAAEAIFQTLRETAATGRSRYENAFNLGNARFMQGNLEGAIAAYESALRTKPDDVPASSNLALAKKKLKEKRDQPTPTPTQKGSATAELTPSPSPQPGTPSPTAVGTASPEPSGSPTPGGTPSPGATPDAQGTQKGSPTPVASGTVTASNDPQENPSGTPTAGTESATPKPQPVPSAGPGSEPIPTPDVQSMSEKEADLWLDSLPDSPLLLRKNREQSQSSGQTW